MEPFIELALAIGELPLAVMAVIAIVTVFVYEYVIRDRNQWRSTRKARRHG